MITCLRTHLLIALTFSRYHSFQITDDKHRIKSANKKGRCNLCLDRDLEIVHFLKVALSFVVREMEATDGDSNTKHKTPAKCPNTIRSPLFVHEVQRIIDKNHKNSLGVIAKGLIVLRHFISRIVGCGAER